MKQVLTTLIVLICTASLLGCTEMTRQDVGTLAGGVAGGLLGSTVGGGSGRMVAIAAGAVAGAYLGGAIGKDMDEHDRARMCGALEHNSVGQPAYWRNAHSGAAYQVVPTRNMTVSGNEYCREYRTIAVIGGKKREMYGTACRQPDGSWKTVS